MRKNVVLEKSQDFAIKIILFFQKLEKKTASSVLGKQLLRSGTSIGANIFEAQDSASKKEFIQKLLIALREARESGYWLDLMQRGHLAADAELEQLIGELDQITALLVSIVKSSKRDLK